MTSFNPIRHLPDCAGTAIPYIAFRVKMLEYMFRVKMLEYIKPLIFSSGTHDLVIITQKPDFITSSCGAAKKALPSRQNILFIQ